MAKSKLFDRERIFDSKPEEADESVVLAFVSILFGVVAGLIMSDLADQLEVVFDGGRNARDERVWHLLVGAALTILSYIGYYSSANSAHHRIKFLNLPFVLFCLDVLMVFVYYVLFRYAEAGTGLSSPDALPEALVVFVSFVLYLSWDFISWRIRADEGYQAVLQRDPIDSFGRRRWVTFFFTILFGAIALVIWLVDPSSSRAVVRVDVLLIVLLALYRLAKVGFDDEASTRDR